MPVAERNKPRNRQPHWQGLNVNPFRLGLSYRMGLRAKATFGLPELDGYFRPVKTRVQRRKAAAYIGSACRGLTSE